MGQLVVTATAEAAQARRQAGRWRAIHVTLGVPTAVLAAVAGATALASTAGRIPAAILALIAAGLSAASTFLGSDTRATLAERKAGAWSTLAADARLIAAFEGHKARSAELRNQVTLLLARQDAIFNGDFEAARRLRDEGGAGRLVAADDYPRTPGAYL